MNTCPNKIETWLASSQDNNIIVQWNSRVGKCLYVCVCMSV